MPFGDQGRVGSGTASGCNVEMTRTEVTIGALVALVGAAATIMAAHMQADATIVGARIQADSERPALPKPELYAAEVPFSAPALPIPPIPQSMEAKAHPPPASTTIFEGFVRGLVPEAVGKVRLEIREDESTGRSTVQVSWFAGLEGNASLIGVRNVRGELNAQGSVMIQNKQMDCRLSAVFTSERRIEGEYTITDQRERLKVERQRFFAIRS